MMVIDPENLRAAVIRCLKSARMLKRSTPKLPSAQFVQHIGNELKTNFCPYGDRKTVLSTQTG